MVSEDRIDIARLSTGIDYPLASGDLIRKTHPTGRTEWEVRAEATLPYILAEGVLHKLRIVARDGQSYTGNRLVPGSAGQRDRLGVSLRQ